MTERMNNYIHYTVCTSYPPRRAASRWRRGWGAGRGRLTPRYVPCLPPDELHPDDEEDEEQAGDDQHLDMYLVSPRTCCIQMKERMNTYTVYVPCLPPDELHSDDGEDEHLYCMYLVSPTEGRAASRGRRGWTPIVYVPCLRPDELHPNDGEDEHLYIYIIIYLVSPRTSCIQMTERMNTYTVYVPCLPPDELHPDDGEDEEQAGDDQHLLQQTVNS